MAPEFQYALDLESLPDGGRSLVEIEQQLVLIFRIGDQVFCLDDVCTHDGGPLSDGERVGFEVACPRHGARFDIRTGKPLCMPATQPTRVHECRIEDGRVYVRLNRP